ncbi:MAG: MSHA biogenesis protein MshK [Betaproteobacteria bacterium]|nr:MSHA biogenesis protein MshK [Betaproteobacteria bacterium]
MLALWCGEPAAQPARFVDPTRPPNAIPEGSAATPGEPRLQSVLIAPGRRVAVIDGQPVTVGGKIADSTVVRIAVGEVMLRQGEETRTLKLLPDAQKVPSKRAGPERRSGKEGSQ